MTKPVLALVLSSSGDLQNGLLALMTTIPQISAVLAAEELSSALRLIENHQPALIILDGKYPKLKEVIKNFKTLCPQTHLIVLAEDISQQKEAKEFGADSVLIKGFPAQKLIEIVEGSVS